MSSSKDSVTSAVSSVASKRTLVFEARASDIGVKPEHWKLSSGVMVAPFESNGRRGVTFASPAGGRARARTSALPQVFGSATEAKVRLAAVDATDAHPVTVRINFYDGAGGNRWSRAVTLTDSAWKTVTLQLPSGGPGAHVLSPFGHVASWGLSFDTEATVRVERFALWQTGTSPVPEVGLQLLDYVAGEPAAVRVSRSLATSWLRDEPVLEARTVFDGMLSMHRQVAEFPGVPSIEEDVPLMKDSVQSGMHSLWNLAAQAVGAPPRKAEPKSDFGMRGTSPSIAGP
ncbi:MAG: hypothetical protein AAGA54_36185 [Myxococcota bacterium]